MKKHLFAVALTLSAAQQVFSLQKMQSQYVSEMHYAMKACFIDAKQYPKPVIAAWADYRIKTWLNPPAIPDIMNRCWGIDQGARNVFIQNFDKYVEAEREIRRAQDTRP